MTERRVLVIGEVALAHDGSLGFAHAFIDAIANAGADAVKFQTHIADAESTAAEPWRVKFSQQDVSRYAYWERTAFTESEWHGLKQHADLRQLKFITSPFSTEAVEMMERVGVAAWKVPSGELNNLALIDRMTRTGAPILVSSGMSDLQEIDAVVELVQARGVPLTVMQCTSMYPTPPEKLGLNMLPFFAERYGCEVGLSDHSATVFAGVLATWMGISALEVHVTLSREMFGPDVKVSLTTAELRQLIDGVRFVETAQANPVDKQQMAQEMAEMRRLFTKSVVALKDLHTGTVLQAEHLGLRKPGTGLPPSALPGLLGRRLTRMIKKDQAILETDLE